VINTDESELRINSARKFLEVAKRMEAGEATDQEIIDAFQSAPARVIDEIEAEARARGLPPLPRMLNPGSPEFHAAMNHFKDLHFRHDEATPQEFMLAFIKMFRLAPPWWKAEIDQLFDETFTLSPDGYTGDGNPVFSARSIALLLGKSESEIVNDLDALEASGIQISVTEKIHSIN
jgi:hypothetical protein